MKVGDLVELSNAGRNTVYCRSMRGKTGIVVEIRSKKECMYPIVVNWIGVGNIELLRSSLKYVSKA